MSADPSKKHPKAWISYSWDSADHKEWARGLATRLRTDGVDVTIDKWSAVPGDHLPHYAEAAIRDSDFVLIVCTPTYKKKSDERAGGVGYEGDVMTAEVWTERNHRKFIPILRVGDWRESLPSWLKGKYGIDLSGNPFSETEYADLLATLHDQREELPPLGRVPQARRRQNPAAAEASSRAPEPIRIEGLVVDEIGRPRNDGTRGCALYAVPVKLNRSPDYEWSSLFAEVWDHPPSWSTSHRPGIARVSGDKIILDGTTIEEVKEAHRDTLLLVVKTVNGMVEEASKKRALAEEAELTEERRHREHLDTVSKDLRFD